MKGIYKITQESTGKVYIGQSIHIDNRWNQHASSIDNLSFHEAYSKDPMDFSFRTIAQNDAYTKSDLDRLEKHFIELYRANDPKYGFNATKGNGKSGSVTKGRMLAVRGSINRFIHSTYLRNVENKNILVIGQFKIDTLALYNNITVLSDDYSYDCEDAKIIRVGGVEEIMKELEKIKEGQFDLIIANPPYNKGNEIVSTCVTKVKESIVLMPFSCYRASGLYKHILSLDLADPKAFKDAVITNNLCVCKLISKEIDQSYEEWQLNTRDQRYREFYELNLNLRETYGIETALKDLSKIDMNTWFLTTFRTARDGVHKTADCLDFSFNVQFLNDRPIPFNKYLGYYSPRFLIFKSRREKENLSEFWYKNPLMNALIKGLNQTGGTPLHAIPRIDFSVDRDYEHLTYDELLQIMKDELKNK